MTADEWNAAHPVPTRVRITLANGNHLFTWTKAPAVRVGQFEFVEVDAMRGLVLLSWCEAMPAGL